MSYKKTMIGIVAGAAAGALLGILFAPQSGAKTRKKIKNKTLDMKGSMSDSFSNLNAKVKDLLNKKSHKISKEEIKNLMKNQDEPVLS